MTEGSRLPSCRSPRADGILINASTIMCPIPLEIYQAEGAYWVALEGLYTAGPLLTLACFSHQHIALRKQGRLQWDQYAGLQVPAVTSNVSIRPDSNQCTCQARCELRVVGSQVLWCAVAAACAAGLPVQVDNTTVLAIPCHSSIPGLPRDACAATCRGQACTLGGGCECVAGWQGPSCQQAECNPVRVISFAQAVWLG